jgi:hypothetical protein
VFESGKHESVEVWAKGKNITMLKLLLFGAWKVSLSLLHVSLSVFQVVKGVGWLHDSDEHGI